MTYIYSKKPTRIYGAKTSFIHCSLYITIEREKTHAIFEKNIKKSFIFSYLPLYWLDRLNNTNIGLHHKNVLNRNIRGYKGIS